MPATVVHAYFAQDLNDILPKEIKNKLDVNRLKTFGQSTDSLMFYNLFSILPGKNIRDFQKYFHTNKTQEFFINLINYIKENDYTEDIDVNSLLYILIFTIKQGILIKMIKVHINIIMYIHLWKLF